MGDDKELAESLMNGRRRFFAEIFRIEDAVLTAEALAKLARRDPLRVFDRIDKLKKPEGYAILAGVYRQMIDAGEGDTEFITRLWNKCLVNSADYLGIEFQDQTPKMAAKLRTSGRKHGGVYRK